MAFFSDFHHVSVLLYGLVRSNDALRRTLPTLQSFVLAPLRRRAAIRMHVHVYCLKSFACNATETQRRLDASGADTLIVDTRRRWHRLSCTCAKWRCDRRECRLEMAL